MITETEVGYLKTLYERGRRARITVERDQAYIDTDPHLLNVSDADTSIPLSAIAKFLKLTVITETGSSADNSQTYYTLTGRGYQVVDNPEIIHQLTAALYT